MMRALARASLSVIALAGMAATANAEPGQAATAQGSARANVIEPISVTPLADLSFGAVALADGSGGQVIVGTSAGDVTYTATTRAICGSGSCAAHPARFSVRGEADRDYQVQVPAAVLARGRRPSSPILPVEALVVASDSLPGQASRGKFDTFGADEFSIGGTLTIPAGTGPDLFRAEVPVVVSYI